MTTDERAWKDKWDGKVSVDCPKCKAVIRLQQRTAEYDEVPIVCPECGASFAYERPT